MNDTLNICIYFIICSFFLIAALDEKYAFIINGLENELHEARMEISELRLKISDELQ